MRGWRRCRWRGRLAFRVMGVSVRFQTLIASVLHKYASGRLSQREALSPPQSPKTKVGRRAGNADGCPLVHRTRNGTPLIGAQNSVSTSSSPFNASDHAAHNHPERRRPQDHQVLRCRDEWAERAVGCRGTQKEGAGQPGCKVKRRIVGTWIAPPRGPCRVLTAVLVPKWVAMWDKLQVWAARPTLPRLARFAQGSDQFVSAHKVAAPTPTLCKVL